MRLPFRGYVTTNYDPGLLEARLHLRPEVRATGYCTWKDADTLERWLDDRIFAEERCPLLHAHGIYHRSETLVLGVGEYRDAYRPGLFRRVFEKLWAQEHLVFAGFGFSDPWIDFIADEVVREALAEPRHLALVGLPAGEPYTAERRRLHQEAYGAQVIFYPIGLLPDRGEDHGALLRLLEELAPPAAVPVPALAAAPAPVAARPEMPACWVHETTHDERYVRRAGVLAHLDRWADDAQVRAIAVTGLGGLGKTALVGHWLLEAGGARRREYAGLFYWSFYADRSVLLFLDRLLDFARRELGIAATAQHPVDAAATLVGAVPLLIVLDGLEVLQEEPGQEGYGDFVEEDLRVFLDACCRTQRAGLVLLTSRFPFADLTRWLGRGLHALDLGNLSPAEGAELLLRSGVPEDEAERQEASRRLDGHPLALRVLASALSGGRLADLEDVLGGADPLTAKLGRLLRFYEEKLPPARTRLLGVISLFRTPVEEATVLRLGRELPGTREILGALPDPELRRHLEGLCHERLLLRESDAGAVAYGCHPVLRDHFRRTLLQQASGIAAGVADFLAERPSSARPADVRELEPVLAAIELLLDAGDFERADELFRGRTANGKFFKWLPAPQAGARCALGFVRDDARRQRCEAALSRRRLGWYLNDVANFRADAGEPRAALPFYRDAEELDRREGDKINLAIGLQNLAELHIQLGELALAEARACEALALSRAIEDEDEIRNSLPVLADALASQGRSTEALAAFAEANEIEKRNDPDGDELYSSRGIWWAQAFLRHGRRDRVRQLTAANLRICERNGWGVDIARCHWLLGCLDTAEGRLDDARGHLDEAERTLRRGHVLAWLGGVLIARAELLRRSADLEGALRVVDEALDLAAPRGYRLDQTDALVCRGHILLDRHAAAPETAGAAPLRALDDGHAALSLAAECGYRWAERDAQALLARAHAALGDPASARAHQANARDLDADLLAQG